MKALSELAQAAGVGYTEKAARKTLADPAKKKLGQHLPRWQM